MKSWAILSLDRHRPWPLPERPWIMRQEWHELLFAHWPVSADTINPLLPSGLALDTYDGQAWVGIVPFRMAGVRPRATPQLPWFSAFPELNVRTYVSLEEKPGVFFFSLDAANPVAVQLARRFFALSYFNARMQCIRRDDAVYYTSVRTHTGAPEARLTGTYRPIAAAGVAVPGSLEHWLTVRYCLYSADHRFNLFRGEIHHPPWMLHPAEASLGLNTMARASGIELPTVAPLLHYSERQDVLVWLPERVTNLSRAK
jgi:uncharacterized protein